MILSNIGMIAADTSRSKVYLQSLIKNNLLPSFVLFLKHDSNDLLPGQLKITGETSKKNNMFYEDQNWSDVHFDLSETIEHILESAGIPYQTSNIVDINAPAVADFLKQREEKIFIYSGYGGVLLRQKILSIGIKFLHVHGGYLPDFKGSTTNYYSLITENTIGASAIFLSEEIDSGPVLLRQKFPAPVNLTAIDHFYDSAARAKVLVQTLKKYTLKNDWEFDLKDNSGGETYYVIHPVLKHIAILKTAK